MCILYYAKYISSIQIPQNYKHTAELDMQNRNIKCQQAIDQKILELYKYENS